MEASVRFVGLNRMCDAQRPIALYEITGMKVVTTESNLMAAQIVIPSEEKAKERDAWHTWNNTVQNEWLTA